MAMYVAEDSGGRSRTISVLGVGSGSAVGPSGYRLQPICICMLNSVQRETGKTGVTRMIWSDELILKETRQDYGGRPKGREKSGVIRRLLLAAPTVRHPSFARPRGVTSGQY